MPTQPDQRNRRVTDKQGISFDAAAQAVKMAHMQGAHDLLAASVQSSMMNVNNTMASVQSEVRAVLEKVTDVSSLRLAGEQDRATMGRIEKTLTALGDKIDTRFERMERENEDRWLRHEAENENSFRELQTQIDHTDRAVDHVERKISRAVGWVSGISVCAALLVGGALWAVNFRFEDVRDDTKKIDPQNEKIHAIELYLARGGQTPSRAYVPPKENPDEQ